MTKINYILVLLIIFFLSSCGESKDGSKDNHGYGWAYDISYNGLLLRGKWQLEPEEIYEIYTKAINCIGYAEPPFIIFKSGSTNGINSCGVYYKDPALIVINKDCRSYQERSEERRVGKECRSRWSPYH